MIGATVLNSENTVYRILDANLNRLREGLRIIEEYFRFLQNDAEIAVELKKQRHELIAIEIGLGKELLLFHRDISSDCFANENRPEELNRTTAKDILYASFKRVQEAARVLEEYTKITKFPEFSEKAKKIRFSLYAIEKKFQENE
jgi:thiamine-phosphate pyrophosphorylase